MGFLKRLLGDPEPEPTTLVEPTDLGDQRGQLPDSVVCLHPGVGGIDVVGESNYRDAIDHVVRGPHEGGVRATYWAELVPETNNPYDNNAVAVRINGERLGYLARADAKRYRPVLEDVAAAGRKAAVRCSVMYGWTRPGQDRGDYSLRVYMDSPERQVELLVRNGIPTRAASAAPAKQVAKPQALSVSVEWHENPRAASAYEGYVRGEHVADIEKAYDPERWIWSVRVPISGKDRGWPRLLRDAKAEAEQALASRT